MRFVLLLAGVFCAFVPGAAAQSSVPSRSLSLAGSRALAQLHSHTIRAAQYMVDAERGRELQAKAFSNPSIAYNREQTSRDGNTNSQEILSVVQPLDITGQRGARQQAATIQREAATSRQAATASELDYEVTRGYGNALAAERRSALADEAAQAFARAARSSESRLTAGDVSGYQHRRLMLESVRYQVMQASARVARDSAMGALRSMLGLADSSATSGGSLVLTDSLSIASLTVSVDSLVAAALVQRHELRALSLDAAAGAATARLAAKERIPVPVIVGGYKRETLSNGSVLDGYIAGISLPLPLWDRRTGAVAAAESDAAAQAASVGALRRQTSLDVRTTYAAHQALATELELLQGQLGESSRKAREAAETAYREGEIGLLEWLDSVRAYFEAGTMHASLQSEYFTRRAALERASGVPLF